MHPLISADELRAHSAPLHVLDARWALGRADGYEQYLDGHIPGAVFLDVERDLTRHGEPQEGRHPLPDDAALAAAARRWGLRRGVPVIVYDDARMLPASRAWWALRRAGLDVRVLDGGWQAWLRAGGGIETGEVLSEEGDVVLGSPGPQGIIGTREAGTWSETGVLLDARASERFRGESEPIDPVAGHIPGARNLPIGRMLTEDGCFRSASAIEAAFDEAGAEPGRALAAYCGSGITAAQLALAGALIGREVAVYPGSWSAWSNTPGCPVATGAA